MKKIICGFLFVTFSVSCTQEKIAFTNKTYEKKTTLPCSGQCTFVKVTVPIASHRDIVEDSINNKIFSVSKEIIYFGEKPYSSKNYEGLLASFIGSYEQLFKEFPEYSTPWEASVDGKVVYQTEEILNLEIKHYSFTGGAHGYGGVRSILINPKTGTSLHNTDLFSDEKAFEKLAEQKFRTHFKIPASNPINSSGMMFENEKFHLPSNLFYTDKGVLLYYNPYEIASYAEGAIQFLLPYTEIEHLLKTR